MKTQILFVDDEPMILAALERMLRSMRHEWEMEFVTSADEALSRMEKGSFDVVVSDMRMPGMNGAQLLAEVMKRHPHVVRLILSGYADQDLILQCVGSTHQYLAKPCDPEMLKATVRRAASVERALTDGALKDLLAQMDRLPAIPSLYVELVEALQEPETRLEDVGQIIAQDPAMTAKVLQLVNSAFFGLGREITTPAEAAAYLGLDTIKSLVLCIHAFCQYEGTDLGQLSLDQLWRHSLSAGAVAKSIIHCEEGGRKLADEAFTAGLLHDTGKLVMAANFSKEYEEAMKLTKEGQLPLASAEQEVLGASHAEVGGYLLGLWGLPVPIVEAIALHHSPSRAFDRSLTPLTAVHVADAIVHEREANQIPAIASRLDLDYLAETGFSNRVAEWQRLKSP